MTDNSGRMWQDLGPGSRVRVKRDPEWAGPWPSEPLGTIEPILGEPYREIETRDGRVREFTVRFDEPQLDADGDGPFFAATIWECYLEPIGEIAVDQSRQAQAMRQQMDQAVRAVISAPEDGVADT